MRQWRVQAPRLPLSRVGRRTRGRKATRSARRCVACREGGRRGGRRPHSPARRSWARARCRRHEVFLVSPFGSRHDDGHRPRRFRAVHRHDGRDGLPCRGHRPTHSALMTRLRSGRHIRSSIGGLMMRAVARWTVVALCVGAGAARAQQASGGQLVFDTVHSKALERNLYGDSPDRSVAVYLPASYASSPAKRYPVVYLLHGYGATEGEWLSAAPLKPAMDTLVRAGTVREMIVVMPNGRNVFGGSFYTNSVATGNWDDFISKD